MFVFAEDRIDLGGSISHTQVEPGFCEVPEFTRSGLEDGYVSDDRCFSAGFMASGDIHTVRIRSWWSQSSVLKTLRANPRGCTDNGGILVVPLLKALFGGWTYSRVKTLYLTMMVGSDDDGGCALLPSCRRRFGESFSESRCCLGARAAVSF